MSPRGAEAAYSGSVAEAELAQDGDHVGAVRGIHVHIAAALGLLADRMRVLLEQPDQSKAPRV